MVVTIIDRKNACTVCCYGVDSIIFNIKSIELQFNGSGKREIAIENVLSAEEE